MDDLHTVAEVAAKWRCSRQHVYDEIAAGRLKATNISGKGAMTRISESALAEYVKVNTRRAPRGRAA